MKSNQKGLRKRIIKIVNSIVNVVVLLVFIWALTNGSLLYFVLGAVVFVAWRIYLTWDSFMMIIHMMETYAYGKPLVKGLWRKGEFKNHRKGVKIRWNKWKVKPK